MKRTNKTEEEKEAKLFITRRESEKKWVLPTERKELLDFVENAWKEVKLIEADQRHKRNLPLRKSRMLHTSFRNQESSFYSSRQSPFNMSYTRISGFKRSTLDPTQDRVSERIKGAHKLSQALKTLRDQEVAKQRIFETETRAIDTELYKVKSKLVIAQINCEKNNSRKAVVATNTVGLMNKVLTNMKVRESEQRSKVESKYMQTAKKIETCKDYKTKVIKDCKKTIEQRFEQNKILHDENYKKLEGERTKKLAALTRNWTERISSKKRNIISVT